VTSAMMLSTAQLSTARAEALFASELSAYGQPTREEIAEAIRGAVRRHGGTRGCAGEVAAAYGEHPETAAPRMRWARTLVDSAYARPPAGVRRIAAVPAQRRATAAGTAVGAAV
jgi:hypothetical protein